MADSTADHEHGTNPGYGTHIRNKTEPCDPCRKARNRYQSSYLIRKGNTTWLPISVSALRELLNDGDPFEVLTRERGSEIVAAILDSGGAS